jgi:hypothetical protein
MRLSKIDVNRKLCEDRKVDSSLHGFVRTRRMMGNQVTYVRRESLKMQEARTVYRMKTHLGVSIPDIM